ncbi:type II toxin-antitoxin system VapC family toxin [Corynebacterium glaucum]|uniref:type II toxin-antitoxin system VapC family toxin n=1 Tax=Corynebacterium glaucum TaxID=187491 RepID=UPI00265817AA|nr:type II toxin-antitoxin system VapC family toxin [Corynebacterium glaucum]WJZ08368.1 Ribonuclease VapC3 [Corynebacterium glaucum]
MVLDTSAFVELLMNSEKGREVATLLADDGYTLSAPQLLVTEVVQVLRRRTRAGLVSPSRASAALAILTRMDVRLYDHLPLTDRVWELRDNLSAYDATFVALAEALHEPLVTCDARLAKNPASEAAVVLIGGT